MTQDPQSPERYIVSVCEGQLEQHGDTFRGAGYTRSEREAAEQYRMMLEVVRETSEPISLLDLGCGPGHLYDFLKSSPKYAHIAYTGIDISSRYLEVARTRAPEGQFVEMNILESDGALPVYDYVIMNGLFNYRGQVDRETMLAYWQRVLQIAWKHGSRGIAFNVMSKIVDWERDDLFYLPFDDVAAFVSKHLSRHFVIRHDYGRYEFTTYVYAEAPAY